MSGTLLTAPSEQTRGLYAIVLEADPRDPLMIAMQRQVDRLCEKTDTASFRPHVTLRGDLELTAEQARDATDQIARGFRPIDVTFDRAEVGPEGAIWARSAYYRVKDGNPQIAAIRDRAGAVLGIDLSQLMPHSSFVYWEQGSEPERRALLDTVVEAIPLPVEMRLTRVALWDIKGKGPAFVKDVNQDYYYVDLVQQQLAAEAARTDVLTAGGIAPFSARAAGADGLGGPSFGPGQ